MARWTKHLPWDLPDAPGCYVAYLNGQVVYVGHASTSIRRRFDAYRIKQERYSAAAITPWGRGVLDVKVRAPARFGEWAMTELRLIRRLRPACNVIHNGGRDG